jgi:hypothetical protein
MRTRGREVVARGGQARECLAVGTPVDAAGWDHVAETGHGRQRRLLASPVGDKGAVRSGHGVVRDVVPFGDLPLSALGDRMWNAFGAGRERRVPAAHHAGVANRGQAELEGGAMWIR